MAGAAADPARRPGDGRRSSSSRCSRSASSTAWSARGGRSSSCSARRCSVRGSSSARAGRAWRALGQALREGRMPAAELADGIVVLVGGLLLVVPGFVTDLVGLVLILPLTRPVARGLLAGAISNRVLARADLVTGPGVTGTPAGPGRCRHARRSGPAGPQRSASSDEVDRGRGRRGRLSASARGGERHTHGTTASPPPRRGRARTSVLVQCWWSGVSGALAATRLLTAGRRAAA